MIHEEHIALAHAPFSGLEGVGASDIDTLLFQLFLPFFLEFFLVDLLVTLKTCAFHIRAVGNAFIVDDLGLGLVQHLLAHFPHGKCQVGIFAVSGSKELVKASQLLPNACSHQNGGTGNVVHFLHIVVLRILRVLQSAIVPAGSIGPDNAARLLQSSVRVYQLGSYDSRIRSSFHQLHQGGKPALCHFRIIVQEENVFSLG